MIKTNTEILQDRARMILSDGKNHAPSALKWANSLLKITFDDLIAEGFTLREISLGAVPRSQATFTKPRPGL